MRACPVCGSANDPTDDFCGNCGSYLGWSDTEEAAGTPTRSPAASEPAPPPPSGTRAASPTPTDTSSPPDGPHPEGGDHPGPGGTSPRPATGTATDRPVDTPTADGTPPAGPAGPFGQATERDATPEVPPPPAHRPAGDTPERHPDAAATPTPPVPTGPTPAGTAGTAPAPPPRTPTAPPTPNPPAGPGRPVRPTATPDADDPPSDAVRPVRPAKPVAPRPVVRPVAATEENEVPGRPCPSCGAPNPPERRFCRRCAAALHTSTRTDPLPWWRTVWPFRRRARAGSGRLVRLLVIFTVVAALCVGGVLFFPTARDLYETTLDKLADPKPVAPVTTEGSAEVRGHPAAHTIDGVTNRYWGAPGPGASVTYTFADPFRLVDVVIFNGASKAPEDYGSQARALRVDVEVTTRDGAEHRLELTLGDKPGQQTFHTGISEVATVRLVVRSAVGLTEGRHVAIGEVEFYRRS